MIFGAISERMDLNHFLVEWEERVSCGMLLTPKLMQLIIKQD
jgi:hypothetical protein